MAAEANTLLNEARCLGCASNASTAEMLKLALWQRLTDVDEIVDSFVERSGISDSTQLAAIRGLVLSARVHGWWNKCDLIYPFVGGTAAAHAENLKSASFPITWNGTVTHDANGITGDGATGYGDTGYVPSSSGQMLLNSTHAGVYLRTRGSNFGPYHFGTSVGPANEVLALNNQSSTQVRFAVNNNNIFPSVNAPLRFITISRTDSALKRIYGPSELTVAQASQNLPTDSLYLLANHTVGALGFNNSNLAGLTAGSGVTFALHQRMAEDWQVFNAVLSRNV